MSIEDIEDAFEKIYYKGRGYYCVAVIYLYNNWFEEAFALEQYFIGMKYYEVYRKNINAYLGSLIVKSQKDRLEIIFADPELKLVGNCVMTNDVIGICLFYVLLPAVFCWERTCSSALRREPSHPHPHSNGHACR